MEQLIRIIPYKGDNVVSARELHALLQSKQDFSTWIKNRIEKYGFIEGEDFFTFHKVVERAKRIEYALTLRTAKEIAMVEGNEMGKQLRHYFIECERQLIEQSAPKKIEPPTIIELAEMVIAAEHEKARMQKEIKQLSAFTDAVTASDTCISIGELSKLIYQGTGVEIGPHRLFERLRTEGYLMKGGRDKNVPTQRAMEKGLFRIDEAPGFRGEEPYINRTTRVTGVGQKYFVEKFLALVEV